LWGDYLQVMRQSLTGSSRSISLDQAAAVPYASLGFRLDGGSQTLLVLATNNNGDQLWTAKSRIVLLTRNGRLLRSVGLPKNRGSTTDTQSSTPPPAAAVKAPFRSTRIVDLADIGAYSVRLNCSATARGLQLIRILGTAIVTIRVDETCQSESLRWSFTDSYWVDAESGFVWKSLQHPHPGGGTLEIEILRPPE
jgi:hypothetical protein